jgi:hypothetical protein
MAGFWRPGEGAPRPLGEERAEDAEHDVAVADRFGGMPLAMQRARLPIYQHRLELLCLLEGHGTVVVGALL